MKKPNEVTTKVHPNHRQKGVTLLEYALIAALVAVAAIAALTLLGGKINNQFKNVADKLNS